MSARSASAFRFRLTLSSMAARIKSSACPVSPAQVRPCESLRLTRCPNLSSAARTRKLHQNPQRIANFTLGFTAATGFNSRCRMVVDSRCRQPHQLSRIAAGTVTAGKRHFCSCVLAESLPPQQRQHHLRHSAGLVPLFGFNGGGDGGSNCRSRLGLAFS